MKVSTVQRIFALGLCFMLSLACSVPGLGTKITSTPASEFTPMAMGDKDNTLLGEEYRSDQGGFSLKKAKDYKFDDVIGIVNMTAPDAVKDIGPGIMVIGGLMETTYTNESLYEKLKKETTSLTVSSPKPVTVSGKKGLMADVGGKYNDQPVKGKIVMLMVTPTQQFSMIGTAPENRWNELAPIFEAVLGSAKFFEPKVETVVENPTEQPSIEPTVKKTEPTQQVTKQSPTQAISTELRQWASSAKASSSYSSPDWSASQATGAPNVDNCGDNGLAWASYGSTTVEWIELTYKTPVVPTEINIYQSYNPSQVVEVDIYDINGKKYIAWSGEPEQVENCPDLMTINLDLDKKIMVNRVRIVVDQSVMKRGWNEIDAVELVGVGDGKQSSKIEPTPQKPSSGGVGGNLPAPTNFEGWMAGPIYQGYLKVTPGKTKSDELNNLIGIVGARSTDNWKPRPDHADTFIFKLGQDNMMAWISVTTSGIVYKKAISVNTHPSDFFLDSVTKATYDQLDLIFKKEKALPYSLVANTLKSPGFLLEQNLQTDGRLVETYEWYHANGDRMAGHFYNGVLTGIAGLAFIPKQ